MGVGHLLPRRGEGTGRRVGHLLPRWGEGTGRGSATCCCVLRRDRLPSPLPRPGEVARGPPAGPGRVRVSCLSIRFAPSSGLRPPSPALGRRDGMGVGQVRFECRQGDSNAARCDSNAATCYSNAASHSNLGAAWSVVGRLRTGPSSASVGKANRNALRNWSLASAGSGIGSPPPFGNP